MSPVISPEGISTRAKATQHILWGGKKRPWGLGVSSPGPSLHWLCDHRQPLDPSGLLCRMRRVVCADFTTHTFRLGAVLIRSTLQVKKLRGCYKASFTARHSGPASPLPVPRDPPPPGSPPRWLWLPRSVLFSKQPPQALPWEATCFNPTLLVTLARLHISEGQGVARPSALGGQEAGLHEKI